MNNYGKVTVSYFRLTENTANLGSITLKIQSKIVQRNKTFRIVKKNFLRKRMKLSKNIWRRKNKYVGLYEIFSKKTEISINENNKN